MGKVLGPNATVEHALPTLNDKREYVRVIFANMAECRRLHGDAWVTIGITGEGKAPNHKIHWEEIAVEANLFGAFNGKRPMKNADIESQTWSGAAIDIKAVQLLMGTLNGFPLPKKQVRSAP